MPKNIKRRGEDEIRSLAEAALTQLNLPKNVVKGDWKEEADWNVLYRKLVEEVLELYEVVRKYHSNSNLDTRQRVREEAGDVVNMVMMLADKCEALEDEVILIDIYCAEPPCISKGFEGCCIECRDRDDCNAACSLRPLNCGKSITMSRKKEREGDI